MSIYATLWTLQFPKEGDEYIGCDWIEVTAQGVPPHIGTPTPGMGYEDGDPYASFLPPPVEADHSGDAPHMRAVVFVAEHTIKGTDRHPQEYQSPLLILSGEDYSRITFEELHRRLCDALRGNRAPVIAEILGPGGKHRVIRAEDEDKPHSPIRRTNMRDTARDAERKQIEILSRMGPEGRLHAAIELSRISRKLLREGVQKRHPDYDERQIRLETIRLILPEELFRAAYPNADERLT
ncbi:MAG: hypothetical protein R6X07_15370 [Desulfatiglandales bacterium]